MNTLTSLAGLALLTATVSGCDLATIDSESADSKALLALGHDDHGLIDQLGDDFAILSRADVGLSGLKLSSAQARDAISQIDGLAVNLAGLTDDEIDQWQPLFRAALNTGTPMVVENAGNPDRLARTIGIGVAADAVHVERGDDRIQVTVYGDHSAGSVRGGGDGNEFDMAPHSLDVGLAAHDIGQRLRSYQRPAQFKDSADAQYLYDIDFSTYSWNIGDTGQIATTNMDFEIQLVADQEINRKYALVRQSGGGFNPGNLLQNDNRHRGFFTESIKIWIDSQTSSLSLHAHAPETSTSSSTYSSSTGWTVGVSGGDVASLGYSSSSVVSTTITDFKTINNTAGVDPSWEWALAKVSGKGYNNWKDIYYQDAF
ncbi:MAG: hypothetical protein AAGC55_28090, partial [Myxococcota bacterium]